MVRLEGDNDSSAIHLIAERCRQCGEPIDVISPTWFTLERDGRNPKKPRVRYTYAPDDSALCVACCLASKASEVRAAWEHHLDRLRHRKQMARVPAGATLFHHRDHNAHFFARTDAVHHTDTYFYIVRGDVPLDWRLPREVVIPDDGSTPTLHVWVGVDVMLEGIGASVEVTWNAGNPELGQSLMHVVNWQHTTHDDLMRLMAGTRFLCKDAEVWRGRPPKRTLLTREEFFSWLHQARAQCIREGRPLTDNNLVRFMPISKATLNRYRKLWPSETSITEPI